MQFKTWNGKWFWVAIKTISLNLALQNAEMASSKIWRLACEVRTPSVFKQPNIIRLLGFSVIKQHHVSFSAMHLVYVLATEGGLDACLIDDAKARLLT